MGMLQRDDGVGIYYETHGQGPVILLTHGYSATSQMWQGQIDSLAKTYKLILWDMRGHGQSDAPEDESLYSEEKTVGDIAALLDAEDVQSAVIGGLSLGGYMTLAFRRAHPARAKALLIIDTGPGFKSDEAREGWNAYARKTAARFEEEGLAPLAEMSKEMAMSKHRSALGLARAGRNMLTQKDARIINSLPEITQPSLVIVGAEDKPFLNATDYMAAKIPGAQKIVVPKAGHAVNIDQPAAFNKAVLDFLAPLKL
ncbi:MAG: alpha/beta fold hydrolase [Hyphomonadaceae bacterium]